MDAVSSGEPSASGLFAQAADRRRALFAARDALSAAILHEAEAAGPPSIAEVQAVPEPAPQPPVDVTPEKPRWRERRRLYFVPPPPVVPTLKKPRRPTSWRAKWAAAARMRRRRAALLATGLFDGAWYNIRYIDVPAAGVDPLAHFLNDGSYEGRSPGPDFDTMAYLARYPDVLDARAEPWLHYARHGKAEGRSAVGPIQGSPRPVRHRLSIKPVKPQ